MRKQLPPLPEDYFSKARSPGPPPPGSLPSPHERQLSPKSPHAPDSPNGKFNVQNLLLNRGRSKSVDSSPATPRKTPPADAGQQQKFLTPLTGSDSAANKASPRPTTVPADGSEQRSPPPVAPASAAAGEANSSGSGSGSNSSQPGTPRRRAVTADVPRGGLHSLMGGHRRQDSSDVGGADSPRNSRGSAAATPEGSRRSSHDSTSSGGSVRVHGMHREQLDAPSSPQLSPQPPPHASLTVDTHSIMGSIGGSFGFIRRGSDAGSHSPGRGSPSVSPRESAQTVSALASGNFSPRPPNMAVSAGMLHMDLGLSSSQRSLPTVQRRSSMDPFILPCVTEFATAGGEEAVTLVDRNALSPMLSPKPRFPTSSPDIVSAPQGAIGELLMASSPVTNRRIALSPSFEERIAPSSPQAAARLQAPTALNPAALTGGVASSLAIGGSRDRPSYYDSFLESGVDDADVEASKATREKVLNTKYFLAEYYYSLFAYLDSRRQRTAEKKNDMKQHPNRYIRPDEALREFFKQESEELRLRRTSIKFSDFQTLARIGKGGYGNVFLVREKKTGNIYAMKRMNKKKMKAKNKTFRGLQTEQEILAQSIDSVWLVQLSYSFQDTDFCFLVMEYMPGGDFRSLLSNLNTFSEEDARFYLAEMILAVGDLHRMGYIHRDLKPDNFLIDRSGHIKLADFGLSKKGLIERYRMTLEMNRDLLKSRSQARISWDSNEWKRKSRIFMDNRRNKPQLAYSVVGSPDYMAYELLTGTGYDFLVDWWSIGVNLFEMINGVPPFFGDSPEEVFAQIMDYKKCLVELQNSLRSDDSMSDACWDFLLRLLCEPSERLGRNGGASELLAHKFFAGLDIDRIRDERPPFVPQLENDWDVAYFNGPPDDDDLADEYFPQTPEEIERQHPKSELPSENNVMNFTYARPDASPRKPHSTSPTPGAKSPREPLLSPRGGKGKDVSSVRTPR